jgi:hypothetical protein
MNANYVSTVPPLGVMNNGDSLTSLRSMTPSSAMAACRLLLLRAWICNCVMRGGLRLRAARTVGVLGPTLGGWLGVVCPVPGSGHTAGRIGRS